MKKDSLLNRDFLLLSQGQLVNQAGTQIALTATSYWLKQATDSASLVGLMTAIAALPLLLFGPLGGACADRWSRRNILIFCDVMCGLVACAMALLLQWHQSHLVYLTLGMFLGNFILSSAIAFTNPALNALIPGLVREALIGAAMAFSQAAGLASMILGQFFGGVLLTNYAPAFLFWVDAGTYFISAGAESLVRADPKIVPQPGEHRPGLFHDIADGFRYVWHRRGMRSLLLAAIPLNMLTAPVYTLLPFYTTDSLHEPLARYGYLLAAFTAGIFTGYGVGGKFSPPPPRRHSAVFVCVIGCAVMLLALAGLAVYWTAIVVLALLGCLTGVVTVLALSAFIQQTEPSRRGRVAAVLLTVTQGLTPMAMSLVGVISDLVGKNIRLIYGCCGVTLLASAILMYRDRHLREFLCEPLMSEAQADE